MNKHNEYWINILDAVVDLIKKAPPSFDLLSAIKTIHLGAVKGATIVHPECEKDCSLPCSTCFAMHVIDIKKAKMFSAPKYKKAAWSGSQSEIQAYLQHKMNLNPSAKVYTVNADKFFDGLTNAVKDSDDDYDDDDMDVWLA